MKCFMKFNHDTCITIYYYTHIYSYIICLLGVRIISVKYLRVNNVTSYSSLIYAEYISSTNCQRCYCSNINSNIFYPLTTV